MKRTTGLLENLPINGGYDDVEAITILSIQGIKYERFVGREVQT